MSGKLALPFYFALAKLISQLAVNAFGGYGIFRDELYLNSSGMQQQGSILHKRP